MPRNLVFIAPYLKPQTLRFVDAVRGLDDVRVIGLCQRQDGIVPADRARFDDLVECEDCFEIEALEKTIRSVESTHGSLHRILSILETIQHKVAIVRERFGLAGLTPEVAERFLDKNVMKAKLRELGLPCARHALIRDASEADAFAKSVGWPIVVKPPVGAGCLSTFLVKNEDDLRNALAEAAPSADAPAQAEEFITGEEFSFDTVVVNGEVRFHSINHYLPTPMEVVRNPWIQWTYLSPREVDTPEFADVCAIGAQAVESMGLEFGLSHMEWFRRPDGSIAIGEIAARPPGAQIVPAMGVAHETDFFRVWARAMVDGEFDGPFERKWAVGTAFLRGQGSGRVSHVEGIDEVKNRHGALIAEEYIPVIGAEKSESYEGDGHFLLKSKSTEEVGRALKDIVSTVRVHYH